MRIAWLSVNASYSHTSLALPCLHAACPAELGCEWSVISTTINDGEWGPLQRFLDAQPDLVLASAYLFTMPSLLAILRRFALLRPAARILLGGPEFLGNNEHFLHSHPFVTAVLRGEGEQAIEPFLRLLDIPRGWHTVPGLCWLDEKKGYQDNGMAMVPDALDNLPPMVTDRFYETAKPFASLETSRGCPGRCSFCTSCRFGKPRYYSLERVQADLRTLERSEELVGTVPCGSSAAENPC